MCENKDKETFMKFPLIIILTLLFALSVLAQSVLTNNDVIEMAKTGLSEQIIVAKIKASQSKFDTSTSALKTLTEAKVPDSVVIAMVEKEQRTQEQSVTSQSKNEEARDKIPEQGTLSDISGKRRVYILTTDVKSRDLIAKELSKNKKFEVVDKIENSDFVIRYESYVEEVGAGAVVNGNTATMRNLTQTVGLLNVMMPSLDEKSSRVRLVYSTKKSKYYVWENNPAESTTKQFLKDFEKVASSK
ncbi:hypothetical protein BH24ACI2_BH24ACI2_09090 [soil metagenome]